MSPHSSKVGFSLIELLTVIAVIGILAAIAVPVVGSVRVKARTATSLSNLRQIGAAIQLHVGDQKGCYPGSDGYPATLKGYLGMTSSTGADWRKIFVSPNADAEPFESANSHIPITYGLHARLCVAGNGPRTKAARVANPSRVILAGDAVQAPNNFWQANFAIQNPDQYVNRDLSSFSSSQLQEPLRDDWSGFGIGPDKAHANAGWFRYCNNGAVAVVMADGHVTTIPKGKVVAANLLAW